MIIRTHSEDALHQVQDFFYHLCRF